MSGPLPEIHFKQFAEEVSGLFLDFKNLKKGNESNIRSAFKKISDYFGQPTKVLSASDYPGGLSKFWEDNAAKLFVIGLRLGSTDQNLHSQYKGNLTDEQREKLFQAFVKLSDQKQQKIVIFLKNLLQDYKKKQAYSQIRAGKKYHKAEVGKRDKYHPVQQKNYIKQASHENILRLIKKLKQNKEQTNQWGILKEEEELFDLLSEVKHFHMQHATNHFYAVLNEGRLKSYTEMKRSNPNITSAYSTKGNIRNLGNGDFVFFRIFFGDTNGNRTRYGESRLIADAAFLLKDGWISLHDQLKPAPTRAEKGSTDSTAISKYFKWDEVILRIVEAENINNKTQNGALKDGIQYTYTSNRLFSNQKKVNMASAKTFVRGQTRIIPFTEEIFYGEEIILGIALSAIYELRNLERSGFRQYFLKLIANGNPAEKLKNIGLLIKGLFRIEGKYPVAIKVEETLEKESYIAKPLGTLPKAQVVTKLEALKPEGDGRYNKDLSINPEEMQVAKFKEVLREITDKIPVKKKLRGKFKSDKDKFSQYSKEIEKLSSTAEQLTEKIEKSEVEKEKAYKYFEKELGVDREKLLCIPLKKLFLIREEFGELLEEDYYLSIEDFLEIPIEKLQYILDTETYYQIAFEKVLFVEDLNKFTVEELRMLEDYDLNIALSEKGYSLNTLFKLYKENPKHLDCICTRDVITLIYKLAPAVDPFVMEYAKKEEKDRREFPDDYDDIEVFDLDSILERVLDNLKGNDKKKFRHNLQEWYSKQEDYTEKMQELYSSHNFIIKQLPGILSDEEEIGSEEVGFFQKLFFPETVSDCDEDENSTNDDNDPDPDESPLASDTKNKVSKAETFTKKTFSKEASPEPAPISNSNASSDVQKTNETDTNQSNSKENIPPYSPILLQYRQSSIHKRKEFGEDTAVESEEELGPPVTEPKMKKMKISERKKTVTLI